MSKIIDNIRAEILSGRNPNYNSIMNIETEFNEIPDSFGVLYGYKILVEWKQNGYCEPKDLNCLVENFARTLRKEIYGEIESNILRLEKAVYEQDREGIMANIRDIRKEVFG